MLQPVTVRFYSRYATRTSEDLRRFEPALVSRCLPKPSGVSYDSLFMPIPAFSSEGVLPPHTGNPTDPGGVSPYACDVMEVCQRFATSPERCAILLGWLELRDVLRQAGFTQTFQWMEAFSKTSSIAKKQDRREIWMW